MKRYKVQLTAPAQADMLEIYRYISEELHNPTAAIRLYERIAQAILSLADTPERSSGRSPYRTTSSSTR